MNTVILSGNIVRDPELRTTQNGKKVCSFSLAVEAGKDASGQRVADFFNIVVWGETADALCRMKKKGQYIAVVGRLRNRKYQDKSGNNRVATEVVASSLDFGPAMHDSKQQPAESAKPAANASDPAPAAAPSNNDDFAEVPESEDLPF